MRLLRGHASLVHVPLPKCAGDHLKTEKDQNEEKYAPAETCHDSGGRLFIHFGLFLF